MSLKTKLLIWYIGSLILLAVFFYAFVHILALPHATHAFEILLVMLGIVSFFIIHNITKSLTYLSSEMKAITSENLDRHVKAIRGNDEIADLGTSFNNLLDRLHESFKREQQFIGDVAHELKTPLATLRSTLDVGRSRTRSVEEYKAILDQAINETVHLSATLTNVLDLAWTESALELKAAKKVNLSHLMKELADIAEKLAVNKELKVESYIADAIYVLGYKDKLARAILNIIDNAIKYTAEGNITITLKIVKNTVFIVIKDTGIGIKEKDIPHIFDRFYRAESTEKILGSGLGLAISKSIIVLHKGTVEVESFRKQGAAFVITLPLFSS